MDYEASNDAFWKRGGSYIPLLEPSDGRANRNDIESFNNKSSNGSRNKESVEMCSRSGIPLRESTWIRVTKRRLRAENMNEDQRVVKDAIKFVSLNAKSTDQTQFRMNLNDSTSNGEQQYIDNNVNDNFSTGSTARKHGNSIASSSTSTGNAKLLNC